jgi:uncharacterized protein (DUF1810 family)
MNEDDPYNLARFVEAQAPAYEAALSELRQGRKTSHWMWFIFPQILGLGDSWMAKLYAITSLDEARAYLTHPLLGARLRECTQTVVGVEGRSAEAIFGQPDVLKFRSSLTLFAEASPHEPLFRAALAKYYEGEPDRRSIALLGAAWVDGEGEA